MTTRCALVRLVILVSTMTAGNCISAQPALIPDAPVIKLDEIGLYAIGYQYRGKEAKSFPMGWSGMFEEKTGIACLPIGVQNGKDGFLLHCPWRNGTGSVYQEFAFSIPKVKRVVLRGATAMRSDAVGKSDGATFRVYANGRKLLDATQTDATWRPFEFDLSSYAGKTLTIRFETDPGPKDDSSFDFSIWGGRELVLEGYRPTVVPRASPPAMELSSMWPAQNESVAPRSGFAGKTTMRLDGNTAIFIYEGPDGTLEYRWKRPMDAAEPALGSIVLTATAKSGKPVEIPVAGSSTMRWTKDAIGGESQWMKPGPNSIAFKRPIRIGETQAQLIITGQMIGKSLVLDVQCDQPMLTMLDAGGWGPTMRRKQIPAPYYSGDVLYLPTENMFVNAFLDWTSSSATSQDAGRAWYAPLTDGTYNPPKERIIYTAAWHLAETLPNIPNPPSPFMKQVGNRIVLDIWGGRFTEIAGLLETLHDYGITNCTALIHDWQRSGYDNALPAHLPANPALGGDEGMKTLVGTAVRLGYLIALHENYVDYYTNYDHYDENDIALDSAGKRQLAWYNEGTKMQSFAVKPNAIVRLAETQSPEIHRRYGANADYLDVHSAVPPWFHVDQRSGEEGAGMFSRTWDVHRKLWQFERNTHGGPVFGEGAAHWYWSGYLDGVEAQFRWGWRENNGMDAPLMVDFDLLKIHPLQVNHGMGYYERWWKTNTWGAQPPMAILDQYRMQEVAYGHAGFLGGAAWSVVPLAWLEHNLLSPVIERYATAKPMSISYEIDGKWRDGTEAAKSGNWRRVQTKYDNGLTVTANSSKDTMTLNGRRLPQFGWLAEGAGVTAYTAIRGGVVVDYAETADSVFANARDVSTWNASGIKRIRPEVSEFRQTSPRAIRFTYKWHADENLSSDYTCFVHFSNASKSPGGENISFQQDHNVPKPTSQWKAGAVVIDGPHTLKLDASIADGDYKWLIGLADAKQGGRLAMDGADDGHNRILLGALHVRDNGSNVTFTPEKSTGVERLAVYNRNLNMQRKVVDFGAVRTNGSVMIDRKGADWVLQTLPRDAKFTLELSQSRFPSPKSVAGDDSRKELPVTTRNGWWSFQRNGASRYRWPAR